MLLLRPVGNGLGPKIKALPLFVSLWVVLRYSGAAVFETLNLSTGKFIEDAVTLVAVTFPPHNMLRCPAAPH